MTPIKITVCVLFFILESNISPAYPTDPRTLIIKPYSGIPDVQSDLYEVYMEPYYYVGIFYLLILIQFLRFLSFIFIIIFLNHFPNILKDLRAVSAIAMIQSEGENPIKGEIYFLQSHPPAGPVIIKGNVTGLSPGKHGIHIHQSGDLRNGCEKLGEHFNPYLVCLFLIIFIYLLLLYDIFSS